LLLAEAAQKGWISESVASLYEKGVRAHMDQMSQYDVTATIPGAAQDAYMLANPFNVAKALEQINTNTGSHLSRMVQKPGLTFAVPDFRH